MEQKDHAISRRRFLLYTAAASVLPFAVSWNSHSTHAASMSVGTNFWFLTDDGQAVEGGNPWSGERPFQAGINWSNAYSSGTNIWSQTYLDDIAMYSTLRFMDWNKTNGSGITDWWQRTSVTTDQTRLTGQDTGLAYEWAIDLCNRTNKDAWLCIPLKATDDFIRQCARLWRDNLNSSRRVYIELHNELWLQKSINGDSRNTTEYVNQVANNDGYGTGDTSYTNVVRFLARRSCDIWRIWAEEFGSSFSSRVVKVIAGQSANPDYGNQILQSLDNRTVNPNALYPNAYAIAPYFGHDLNAADSNIWNLISDRISIEISTTQANYNIWNPRGIALVAYEGGQHLVGSNSDTVNRDNRMYDAYKTYLNGIAPYLQLFNHYTNIGTYGQSGNWGSKEFSGQSVDSAPKYRALRDFIIGGSSGGGGARITVTPGGGIANISVPVQTPTAGNTYRWFAKLLPPGASWEQYLANIESNPITVL